MTYFKLIAGFDCGVDKSVCQSGYPANCFNCLTKKFNDASIFMDLIETVEQHSEQKKKEMLYKYIWKKYQDISIIRHVIILSKTGLPAFNMAVGDLPIDASLLSGFIQANVAFSSEDLTLMDRINPEKKFYEFEYKNFNILLCNGRISRICLIVEKKPSNSLKEMLSDFTDIFEVNYKDEIIEFENRGDLNLLDGVKSLVEKTLEVILVYPLTISSRIPPDLIEHFSIVQEGIYECGKDLLKGEPNFFITTLIDFTSKLLGVISKEEILWNIYQMVRENIIIWESLEFQRQELESKRQAKQKREGVVQKIMERKDLQEIIFECQDMNADKACIKINSILKKGEIAEKNAAHQEALNEYQKALTYAKEFNMEKEIGQIQLKISELVKINKNVELNFALEQVNKAEKKKDYVIALKYLFQIRDLLSVEVDKEKYDKLLQKTVQRIQKLQGYFQQNENK